MLCADISMITPFQSGLYEDISPDPRLWSRDDVKLWIQKTSIQYQIFNAPTEKFPTNGKGLLLLSRESFLDRVPVGGGLLYEDLHMKLQRALSEQVRQAQEVDLLLRAGLINH